MTKPGRPEYEPTEKDRKFVTQMSAVGTPQPDIARVLGIDEKTLRKHFRHELDTAKTKANAMVGGALYTNAINGNVAAQIFWMKTQAGWGEGRPIEVNEPTKLVLVKGETRKSKRMAQSDDATGTE